MDRNTDRKGNQMFTVYGGAATREFPTAQAAHDWAVAENARTGAELECRDENFDHVFTVEV